MKKKNNKTIIVIVIAIALLIGVLFWFKPQEKTEDFEIEEAGSEAASSKEYDKSVVPP